MQYNNMFKLGTTGRLRGVTLFDIDLIDWLIYEKKFLKFSGLEDSWNWNSSKVVPSLN